MPRSFVSGHMVRGEKCGLDKNLKSETICLTFSPISSRKKEFSEQFWERNRKRKAL